VPEEIEAEEDLGLVEEEDNDANPNLADATVTGETFEIKVGAADSGKDEHTVLSESGAEESDSESDEDEPLPLTLPARRVRKPSALVGSVKKGKYSK
jgi:hypothetical protein